MFLSYANEGGLKKIQKIFLNAMQKNSLENSFRYRKILKNENISLSYDVNDHDHSKSKSVLTLYRNSVNLKVRQILT